VSDRYAALERNENSHSPSPKARWLLQFPAKELESQAAGCPVKPRLPAYAVRPFICASVASDETSSEMPGSSRRAEFGVHRHRHKSAGDSVYPLRASLGIPSNAADVQRLIDLVAAVARGG